MWFSQNRGLLGAGGGPADEGGRALQVRVAPDAGADEELADLAAQARGVGDDGAEVDVVGHAVERAAERDQRAGVVRHHGVLRIVDDRPGMGQLAPDLQERPELDRRGLAHGAPEERPFGDGIEVPAVLQDAGDELPCAGARERRFPRLRIEAMQQVGPELHEEQHFRRDSVRRAPGAPVPGVDPDFQMDESRRQRRRHAVDHASVRLAVAAGDQRRALGQLVFANLAVEHQLIERRLHHGHRRRQLLQVDEPAAGIVGGRQEGRGRPAGPVGAVAPRDAAQVHGVEQERPDVDILPAGVGGDLLGDGALGAARSSPQDHGLAGLDQEREGGGELARAERVVGGDGVGIGHGQDSGMEGMRRGHPPRGAPPSIRRQPGLRPFGACSLAGGRPGVARDAGGPGLRDTEMGSGYGGTRRAVRPGTVLRPPSLSIGQRRPRPPGGGLRVIGGDAREGQAARHGAGGWCIRGSGDRENRCFVLAVESVPAVGWDRQRRVYREPHFQGVAG